MKIFSNLILFLFGLNSLLLASEDIDDKYPQSELYNKPVEVIPNVFTAIGATAPPTYENAGHNNNLSFVVTNEGVVVIPNQIIQEISNEVKSMTIYEDYVIDKVRKGASIRGLYPLTEESEKKAFENWLKQKKWLDYKWG